MNSLNPGSGATVSQGGSAEFYKQLILADDDALVMM